MVIAFLSLRGVSYSVDELNLAEKEHTTISNTMRKMERNVENLIDQYNTV